MRIWYLLWISWQRKKRNEEFNSAAVVMLQHELNISSFHAFWPVVTFCYFHSNPIGPVFLHFPHLSVFPSPSLLLSYPHLSLCLSASLSLFSILSSSVGLSWHDVMAANFICRTTSDCLQALTETCAGQYSSTDPERRAWKLPVWAQMTSPV